MQQPRQSLRLGAVAMLALMAASGVGTVQAKPDTSEVGTDRHHKNPDPVEWSFTEVQGTVDKMWWADGKKKGTWTPAISFFSNESNVEMTVWVDNPDAQALMRDGTVCVGRFAVADGHRIDEQNLSADAVQVLNPDANCADSLGPPPS